MSHIRISKFKNIFSVGIVTTLIAGSLIGCGTKDKESTQNDNSNAFSENTSSQVGSDNESQTAADDSLASLIGKTKTDESEKVEIPEDYVYSLNENGFLEIGSASEIIDDNFRNYYEIFVLSFYDSDGDGIGDINGVTQKLGYIKEMGFDGIWLMPIMSSPSYHKYDTDDYYLIDAVYGTNDDFAALIESAHEKDINIVIDFVINHSSSEHPWFTTACDYLRSLDEGEEPNLEECPYVDYYHFSKEWASGYSKVEDTEWYYESVFYYTQPDLNYDSEALKNEIADIARFWIGLGVDGFRVDAAAHFEEGKTEYNKEVLAWLYDVCTEVKSDFYMVSEVWLDEATIASYYENLTPSFFNFDSADSSGKIVQAAKNTITAERFVNSMLRYQSDYSQSNKDYIDAVFISNHDMSRVANLLTNDIDSMKMACGLMMSMQGSTFVYYGEEIGMKSSGSSDENKRIAMYWSDTDLEGMTNGPEDADKSIKSNFAAVDEQASDPDSILNYYRRAVLMRNNNPEIARGTMEVLEFTSENLALITKEYEGKTILMIYNTGEEEASIDLTDTGFEDYMIASELTIHPWENAKYNNCVVTLPAQSIVVLRDDTILE